MDEQEQPEENHWKLGFLYYNPNDPKVVVVKRSGLGWTFNFAKPLAYVYLFGVLSLIFAIKYFLLNR